METSIRRDFDLFSWKSSIVLNWLRDSGQMIGVVGDKPAGWEPW